MAEVVRREASATPEAVVGAHRRRCEHSSPGIRRAHLLRVTERRRPDSVTTNPTHLTAQIVLCPCVTFGQIADIVDRGSGSCAGIAPLYAVICSLMGMACLYLCVHQTKMRAHYDLDEGDCPDLLVHWCCEWCALCQKYRERKICGFGMGIDYTS